MKTKFLFGLFIAGIMMMAVGCSDTTNSSPSSNTDTTTTAESNIPPTPEPEKKDTMPTSRTFYEEMLDYFCKLYFKEAFGWKYKEGTILIKEMNFSGDDQVALEGQYDYESDTWFKLRKRNDKPFKATVIRTDKNEYEVTFEKQSRKPGRTETYWENTVQTITYP